MKTNRLLAGTLALVLIAGFVSPASAEELRETFVDPPDDISHSDFLDIAEFDDIIFDNGGEPALNGGLIISIFESSQRTVAEDFTLDNDMFVTDFHFILDEFGTPLETDIQFFIFDDDNDKPGEILTSGFSQNLVREPIDTTFAEIWFDLDEPFLAEAGVKYWFGITTDVELDFVYSWGRSSEGEGKSCTTSVFPPEFDACPEGNHSWFLLSGHSPLVGGEFLPIDSTALVLAGFQTSAIWMLPVLAGVAGSAFGVLYIKSRRN